MARARSWQLLENAENRWFAKENQDAVILRRVTGRKKGKPTTGEMVPTASPFITGAPDLGWDHKLVVWEGYQGFHRRR